MDTDVSRVLRLFRLSVPPVFFLLACYVFLGEHVFGLAYIVGNRLKPKMRTTLRVCYRLASACVALHEACRVQAGDLLATRSTAGRLERVLKVLKAEIAKKYSPPRGRQRG